LRAKVSVFATLFAKAEALAMQVRAVEASAEQFRRLTDAAPIGIFQTDTSGRYVYTNPRWTEITGVASDDAFGQKWGIIFDPEQRADLFGRSADSEMSRTELSYRFEVRARGSEPRVLLATARSIPDNDGGAAGWVGTLAEVTAEEWVETSRA
jgi:PAS domain S-box-containing protein